MSPITKALLKSIFLTTSVCGITGAGAFLLFNSWRAGAGAVLIAFVTQIICAYFLSVRSERARDNLEKASLEHLARLNEDLATPIDLTCAYCNTANKVPINLGKNNVFKCNHCSGSNKIFIQFTTARITTPLSGRVDEGEVNLDGENLNRQTTINENIQIT